MPISRKIAQNFRILLGEIFNCFRFFPVESVELGLKRRKWSLPMRFNSKIFSITDIYFVHRCMIWMGLECIFSQNRTLCSCVLIYYTQLEISSNLHKTEHNIVFVVYLYSIGIEHTFCSDLWSREKDHPNYTRATVLICHFVVFH